MTLEENKKETETEEELGDAFDSVPGYLDYEDEPVSGGNYTLDDIENFVDRKVCDFIIMGMLDLVQINNNQLFITTNDSNIVTTFKKYSKVDVGVNVINMD